MPQDPRDSLQASPTPDGAVFRWTRTRALLFSLALLLVVFAPVVEDFRADPRDDFPLSPYPMFRHRRGETTRITHAVGVDRAGREWPVPHQWLATGGLNQVRRQLRQARRDDRVEPFAERAASIIARRERAPWSDVVEVRVVRRRYAYADFFRGSLEPVDDRVEHSVEVRR